jgi:cytochrome P450
MVYAQESFKTPEGLKFQEICENAAVLIIGGSETTPSALAGIIYLLLCNPTSLATLTSYLRTSFQSIDEINSITVNIDYLLAVLNEALRMYPPVGTFLSRVTPPEGCFIAGRFIPGNTSVSVSQRGVNRSASNFLRPNEFAPQRWTGDAEFWDDKLKVVQSFSVGPRNCIGRNLAFFEMKLVLAKFLYSFDLELCEESRDWMEGQKVLFFNQRPPLMVRLKPYVRVDES